MTENLRSKMARGAAWMVLFRLVDRSIGFLSTLVLARLLTPVNFGVVAMATSLIAMLELIAAFGFDMALIQRADATRAHYDTAWTFNVVLGCALSVLMVALSWPISRFYDQPALVYVICTLAVGSLLQGFQNVGTVAFRKDMEFHKEFRFLVSKRIATVPITIALAFVLRNYWALVAGMVTGRLVDLLLSYRFHPYRPRFDLSAAGDLLHFSKWLLLLNALQFLRDRSPDFVIGRIAGASALGIFSVSYELANMPGSELVAPINRAVYPAYVQLVGDPEALKREYLSVISMICLLAVPAVAGIAATANLLVPLALGQNWLSAIPVLQLVAFFGISAVMQSNSYAVCLALGRAEVFAKLNGAFVAILLVLLVVFVRRNGLQGGAYAYLTVGLVMLPIAFAATLHLLRLPASRLFGAVWRPLIAAGAMFFVVERYSLANAAISSVSGLALEMTIAVLLGVVVYVAFLAMFWALSHKPDSAEAIVVNKLRLFWRNAATFLRGETSAKSE
jgi:O-antigen/teichoic acid export membrane protein